MYFAIYFLFKMPRLMLMVITSKKTIHIIYVYVNIRSLNNSANEKAKNTLYIYLIKKSFNDLHNFFSFIL